MTQRPDHAPIARADARLARVVTVVAAACVVVGSIATSPAWASGLASRWTAAGRASGAAVARGGRVFVPQGNAVVAFGLADGARLWRCAISGLRRGRHAIAASDKHLYAVGSAGLSVIDAASGRVVRTRKARGARSVIYADASLYFSDATGVFRLDPLARTTLGMARLSGELRAVHDKRALIYRVEPRPKKGESRKRLVVLDLSEWRATYTFKLLPVGDHSVAHFDDRHLAFFDHSVRSRGRNSRKLFYTDVDHRTRRKLRDLSLAKLYKRADRDRFSALSIGNGRVVVANYGGKGEAFVFALDTKNKRMMWRAKLAIVSELTRLGSSVVAVARAGRGYELVRLDVTSGAVMDRTALAAAPTGRISTSAQTLLVPTATGVVALAVAPAAVAALGGAGAAGSNGAGGSGGSSGAGGSNGVGVGGIGAAGAGLKGAGGGAGSKLQELGDGSRRPPAAIATLPDGVPTRVSSGGGFHNYRDDRVGYSLRVPSRWQLAKSHVRKFGPGRYAVPFVRYRQHWGRWSIESSLHVLVREAAGQDVQGLWRSIYAHRRRQDPYLRVLRVIPFRHAGYPALIAIYRMRTGHGRSEQVRSFCVVAHGRAYELKARGGADWRSPLWVEIGDIFKTFRALTSR